MLFPFPYCQVEDLKDVMFAFVKVCKGLLAINKVYPITCNV